MKKILFLVTIIFFNIQAFRYRNVSNLTAPIKIEEWQEKVKQLNPIQKDFLFNLMLAFQNFEAILKTAAKEGALTDGKIERLLLNSEHSFYLKVDKLLDKRANIFEAYKAGNQLYQEYTNIVGLSRWSK